MALTPSLAVANGAPVTLLISASTDERGKLLPLSDETRERQKTLSFSTPMFKDSVWLVTRCDRTFDYQHLSQLDGQTIGVVRGTYNGTGFDTAAREGRFRVEYETGDSRGRFEKLLLGRTQVLLMYSRWTASEVDQAVQDRDGMLGAREDGADAAQAFLRPAAPARERRGPHRRGPWPA